MSSGGGGTTQVVNQAPAPTAQEIELQQLNAELAKKQLASIDELAPFQTQLLQASQAALTKQQSDQAAVDAIISPTDMANATKAQFDQSQKLGDIQTQLAQRQLDALNNGGKATPEQIQAISDATNAGIDAGTSDIDTQTQRGIGLIADELANSRGLRLSDSPITSEAALLTRAGSDQKASLVKNLRANQANAVLNYPLAVQGLQSGISLNQQNIGQAAQDFQSQLRQQAYQNRLAMSGQAQSGGLGFASIPGVGSSALNNMTQSRLANTTSTNEGTYKQNAGIAQYGALASGIGALAAFSDRRLKVDYGKVGETESGIDLHVYHYKAEDKRNPLRLGVMADDVRKKRPEAVRRHASGYDVVDYGGIGL